MDRIETFAIVLVILCVAALGIGIVVEAMKYAMLRSKRQVVQGRIERRRQELADAIKRADEKEIEVDKLQKKVDELGADRLRTLSLIKTVLADRIEMVHELGAPDRSSNAYTSTLTPTADLKRLEERKVMFHRDIWKFRNSALIWANNSDEAEASLQRVFTPRSAVQYARPKLHKELSSLPPPEQR